MNDHGQPSRHARRAATRAADPRLPPVCTNWLEGLPRTVVRVIITAGFTSRDEVRRAIEDGQLTPWGTEGLGPRNMPALCAWAGTAMPSKPVFERRPAKERSPSPRSISRAMKILESAGYTVTPPGSRQP
jgi:hypothetical protein